MSDLLRDLLLALLWKAGKGQNPVEVSNQDIQDFLVETRASVATKVTELDDGGYTIEVAPADRVWLEGLAPEDMPSC